MRTRARAVLFAFVVCLVFFLPAAGAWAHVPRFTPGGIEPADAPTVCPPSTSWVFYGDLSGAGMVRFYRLDLEAGERLRVQLLIPQEGRDPGLAVIGPGLAAEGRLPEFVSTPPQAGAIVRPGTGGEGGGGGEGAANRSETTEGVEAEYEPFTPGAYWHPASVDISVPATGSYYVAVFSEGPAVRFAIAVGYEERYTPGQWVKLPADLMAIYAWDGGWWIALVPALAVLVIGSALVAWRAVARRRRACRSPSLSGWLAMAAGLFCLTTAATVLVQMLRATARSGADPAMGITALFVAASVVIGGLLLWLGRRSTSPPGIIPRVGMFVLGLAAIGLLSGYFAGPALAILAAVAPPYRRRAAEAVPAGPVCVDRDGAGRATV